MSNAASSSNAASKKEVAAVRQQLRSLRDNLHANKSDYTSTSSNKLGETLDTANKLYEVGKEDARYAALDANTLSTMTMLGAEQAGNLEKKTPDKFVAQLKALFGYSTGKAIKWQVLAAKVASSEHSLYAMAPACTFITGTFVAPPKKERAARKSKASNEDAGPAFTAKNVDVKDLQETHKDKAQVVRMKVLQECISKACKEAGQRGEAKRVNMFQVLLHPTSFSQTVENFFDLAFLCKVGTVQIIPEPNGVYLAKAKKLEAADYERGARRYQNILQLDYPIYRQLVARWCTPEYPSLLPERTPGAAPMERDDGEEGEEGGDASEAADKDHPKKKRKSD